MSKEQSYIIVKSESLQDIKPNCNNENLVALHQGLREGVRDGIRNSKLIK